MVAIASDAERAANVHSIKALAAQITELAGHLNAGNHRFLMLIAEFDRCKLVRGCHTVVRALAELEVRTCDGCSS